MQRVCFVGTPLGRVVTYSLLAFVFLIATALIVPSFIDWSQFRKPIEAEASRLTGRQVRIAGKIELGLLLRPHLRLGGLTITDPTTPKEPLLSAARFDATASWLPLLMGRIEIAELRLTEARVLIRVGRDGKVNWAFSGAPVRARAGSDTSILAPRGLASQLKGPRRLAFDNVLIERSTILYADQRTGARDQIDKLSGRFSFAGPYGPWSGNAGFQIQNAGLSLAFSVGAASGRVPSPVQIKLGVLDASGGVTIKGNAYGLGAALERGTAAPVTFTGHAELSAGNFVAALRGLSAIAEFGAAPDARAGSLGWSHLRALPAAFSGPLNLDSQNLTLSAQGALSHTRANISYVHARRAPHLDLGVSSDLVDLDEMLDFASAGKMMAPVNAASGPVNRLGVCACTGSVKVTAQALKLHGAALGDLAIDVRLGKDGAELKEARILLPGDARLSFTGRLPHPRLARNGALFDGKMNFAAANPRAFAQWLGVSPDRMSPNAFKTLTLEGPFKLEDRHKGSHGLTPHLDRASLMLDEQHYTLSAAYDGRDPGYILFALEGERLDADAYGIGLFWPRRALSADDWKRTLWSRALRAGEVDVKLDLATLKTAGKTMRGVEANLTRAPDGPASAHVSIASLGGYQILFEGERKKPSADRLGDESARLIVSGPGAPVHLPFAGRPLQGALKLNVSLVQSGAVSRWSLDGSVGTIKLAGEGTGAASASLIPDIERLSLGAKFDRGTAAVGGSLKQLSSAPVLNGNLTVDASDFPSFMRELGYKYEPRRKDLGALSLVSQFTASLDHVGVSSFSASVGDDALAATADLSLLAPRSVLKADIKAARLSLDGYLAAPEKGATWSADRLKLGLFKRFDGEIKFAADRFEAGPWDTRKLSSTITLKDGLIATRDARASLFGGAMAFAGQAQLGEDDNVNTTFDMTVRNFDWTIGAAKLFPALGTSGKGVGSAHVAGSANGRSMMGLVSSLSARAEVSGSGGALEGFDLFAWGAGLNGARGPNALARLSKTVLTRGQTGVSNFRLSAAGSKGTLAIGQGMLNMNGGGGELSGQIDLVPRTMDLRLALVPAAEPSLPPAEITLRGPIGKPVQGVNLNALAASVSSAAD